MKNVAWVLFGAMLSALFILLSGALGIRIIGLESGAVIDLSNAVIGVTSPRPPVLPMLSLATLSVLVTYVLTISSMRLSLHSRRAFIGGFFLASTALIGWAFTLSSDRKYHGPDVIGIREGWQGWLEEAGNLSAVHVVVLLAVGSLMLQRGVQNRALEPGSLAPQSERPVAD